MLVSCAVCGRTLGDEPAYEPGDLCATCAAEAPAPVIKETPVLVDEPVFQEPTA